MSDIIDLNNEEIKAAIDKAATAQYESMRDQAVAKETEGLLTNRDELLSEKKALKAWKEEVESKYDLEKLDSQLEEARQAKIAAMSQEEKSDLRIKEMAGEFTKERDIYESKLKRQDAALKKHLIDSELEREIAANGGMSHLLKPVLQGMIEVIPEGEDYVARVMKNGNPRIGGSDGTYMDIGQLVQEFKADENYGVCFKASGATGGEATGNENRTPAGGSGTKTRSDMTTRERSDYITNNGDAAYFALPA